MASVIPPSFCLRIRAGTAQSDAGRVVRQALGVAALAYDKRGVGESTGDFRAVSFTDLATDGLAGVAWLKARGDINPKQIGVWGLSQGGWLGPLAASKSRDIAFVMAVSGPGVSPAEQMVFYYANELRARGMSDQDVDAASETRRKVWRLTCRRVRAQTTRGAALESSA